MPSRRRLLKRRMLSVQAAMTGVACLAAWCQPTTERRLVAAAGGVGLLVASLVIVIPAVEWGVTGPKAFRRRRERHRRLAGLCAGCGYSRTGNTSGICPECGAALDRRR